VLGTIGGVGTLPARVGSATGAFARAAHAWHTSVFSHADAVAACLPPLPAHASILALTADDGALLDLLVSRNRTLRPLDPEAVLADDVAPGAPRPDVVLLADVLHHVAPAERPAYLERLRERAAPEALFIVKEFAPGGLRARLGWLADCALSGDPVRYLTPPEMRRLAARALPGLAAFWTPLFELEPPNYCLLFRKLRLDRLARGLGA
jgi:nitroreductase